VRAAGALAVLLLFAWPALAQQGAAIDGDGQAAEAAPGGLYTVNQVAAALADPGSRRQALLNMAALASAQRVAGGARNLAGLEAAFRDDRDWLDAQQNRFGAFAPRSPVLDPAAWRVQFQLNQLGLDTSLLASPTGPGLDTILEQAFDRSDPLLAAVALPELLWYLETQSTLLWSGLADELAVLGSPALPWLHEPPWELALLAEPPGEPLPAAEQVLAEATNSVLALAGQLVGAGPSDPSRLQRIRYSLLARMPELDQAGRVQATSLLQLAGLLDGLNERRYFRFTEGLMATSAELVRDAEQYPQESAAVAALLNEILPGISASFAREFAAIDPRLNTALAVAFDVSSALARQLPEAAERRRLEKELADAVARLALLVPDMGFYFDLPVRDPVAGGVDACAGLIAEAGSAEDSPLTRELFDDCLQTLVDLADGVARESQLSGDPDGPFGEAQLNRELTLTAGQRINYGIGYLHDRYSTGCALPGRPLPNPLEWAFLATFMSWFAEQSPVYFQTPENEQRLATMREIGREITSTVSEQVDCLAGVGVGVNDPVKRVTLSYRSELRALAENLQLAQQEFRDRSLAPGADVQLGADAGQSTAYRPDQLQILPCDINTACEMTTALSSTRALVGLFPDSYLLADQTGLGQVEICYDDMGWEERRSEPVRPGDENVANYYGKLAFTLRGRFTGPQGTDELFAFRFRSPTEHHYMFGAAAAEVLEDACPVEWIGQRIVTSMPGVDRGLVPNRLTYLSAPRSLPSRLLASNWDRGSEWRDWFVTGIGVEALELPPAPDITPALAQHLLGLRRLEQEAIYGSLLQRNGVEAEDGLTPLHRELNRLGNAKALIRLQLMLFYPQVLTQSEPLRAALAGNAGLLDPLVLNRFREARVPVAEMIRLADERLQAFEAEWAAVPEAIRRRGAAGDSVVHALARLNALQAQFFTPLPVPAQPLDDQPVEAAPELASVLDPGGLAGSEGQVITEGDDQ
jgi:hypothetical protein